MFPPLPSESTLVTATSLAASGELDPVLVGLMTSLGSFCGDVVVYSIGRWGSDRVWSSARGSGRVRSVLRRLETYQATWGPGLIVAGRFVPGGATAVGLAAGILAFPLRRFLLFSALGSVIWTGYGFAFAYVGRTVFPDSTSATVVAAIALALGVAGLSELVRRLRARQRTRP